MSEVIETETEVTPRTSQADDVEQKDMTPRTSEALNLELNDMSPAHDITGLSTRSSQPVNDDIVEIFSKSSPNSNERQSLPSSNLTSTRLSSKISTLDSMLTRLTPVYSEDVLSKHLICFETLTESNSLFEEDDEYVFNHEYEEYCSKFGEILHGYFDRRK